MGSMETRRVGAFDRLYRCEHCGRVRGAEPAAVLNTRLQEFRFLFFRDYSNNRRKTVYSVERCYIYCYLNDVLKKKVLLGVL